MPSRIEQKVVALSRPYNAVNDVSPGMSVNSGTGQQKYSTLGSRIWLGPDEVLYDTNYGTLYGGVYQYVRIRSTDASAPVRGMLYCWDTTVDEDLYQVSNLETIGGTAGAQTCSFFAGVALSNVCELGNYTFIQVGGKATVKYRAVFTGTAAIGNSVYQAGAGAGADNALADVLDGVGANPTFDQVAQMQRRYIGNAETIPAAGSTSIIQMRALTIRV